jgi:hypothetical protein
MGSTTFHIRKECAAYRIAHLLYCIPYKDSIHSSNIMFLDIIHRLVLI